MTMGSSPPDVTRIEKPLSLAGIAGSFTDHLPSSSAAAVNTSLRPAMVTETAWPGSAHPHIGFT